MKKIISIIFVLSLTSLFAGDLTLSERIEKYSGKNHTELQETLKNTKNDTLKYFKFLVENCSNNDLAVLTKGYLINNIRYALKAKRFNYVNYPESIFRHFVLPHRVSQEPLENWRGKFYNELQPIINETKNIEAAAILVNLWVNQQMTYKPTHGRDQAPLTTIKRGYGRCEESMILYIAAARSVGIPARPASCSYWNFTDSNHAWVEIWTPEGWKYLGEVENSLNRVWFSKTTERSTIITSQALGNYESKNTIKQEHDVTYISSIEYYTDYNDCEITVKNELGRYVQNASVRLYATSFGGLFSMIELFTNEKGKVKVPLGKGTVWVTAYKDGSFGSQVFNLMNETRLSIKLRKEKKLDENFFFQFPLPNSNPNPNAKTEILGDKFYLRRDKSNLKRKNRLNELKKGIAFTEYYDLAFKQQPMEDQYFERRKKFLEKCNELAENSQQFLHILKKNNDPVKNKIIVDMINKWDIKELCEIPDSTAIQNAVDIYKLAKDRFNVPDSIFTDNVIGFTWRSATPPQNGWQKTFYQRIEKLADPKIRKTVDNVIQFCDSNLVIDENFVWTYFSGSLNPEDILNMKHVPKYYRRKVLNCALKILGVPVQWKGRLEYFNGNDFVALEDIEKTEKQDEEAEITISLFVDDKKIKAEPFKNFLISKMDDEGRIDYTYFDGENDSLDFKAKYRSMKKENVYIESFVRNGNGDSNVIVKSINGLDDITLHLETPKEYLDNSDQWDKDTFKNVTEFISELNSQNKKILFIRGELSNEPEVSMLNQISSKAEQFIENNTDLIIYSENRNNSDIDNLKEKFNLFTGKKLIQKKIGSENYPVVLVFNEKNKIIFSSIGFDLGITDLLLKKVK